MRDYDAQTGQWTAKDPVRFAGGPNLYGYALNDPVQLVDPDGTQGRSSIYVPPPTAEQLGLPNLNHMPGVTGPVQPGDIGALYEGALYEKDQIKDDWDAKLAVRNEIFKAKQHIIKNQLGCGVSLAFRVCFGHAGGVPVPGTVSVLPSQPVLAAPGQRLGVLPQKEPRSPVCRIDTVFPQPRLTPLGAEILERIG